ncbi:hypothetical protein OXB_2930 [Bacillus sp. OxB-1]|uniref:hypothetical protein n=1 Tax=Bacillus sp. (strain OxB-1) TaxID=98228 RepID=UPI0005822DAA|nr:hypothetical protein [Bacillus sp. OxB-1]BAQ11401.1 hypothetical protein OXB_2930 [Bacillus sp. OxB-1]
MSVQRKKIIISEIRYWKQNKLLPEHYCDFLITLYAQGEEVQEEMVTDAVLVKEKKSFTRKLVLILVIGLLAGSSMFIFARYPLATLSSAAGVTLLFLLSTFRVSKLAPFLYIISSFLLLMMSLKLWLLFFEGQTMLLIGLLMLNCVLWLYAGKLLKLLYFTISGSVGLLLIIGFLLANY